MIEELRIRGLGVIEEALVPFAPGFTVVTGETGAGKTMVLSGLALIMGDKADAALVRTGNDRADVDGAWKASAAANPALLRRLDEAGAAYELDEDEIVLLLARSIASTGRSRAFAGGRSVPAATLTELTEQLIAVHGQSDQLMLRDSRRQRELLDLFAGSKVEALRTAYAEDFAQWKQAARELRDLVDNRQERAREAALLRHGIAEIAAVGPVAGEDDALKQQSTVLAHATDLLEAVGGAHALLAGAEDPGADSVVESVEQARRSLERARTMDATLDSAVAQLDTVAEAVAILAGELAQYARGLDADPAQQTAVEERRQVLGALKRRYGPTLDDVLAWWEAAQDSVASVDGADERVEELTARVDALRETVIGGARALTAARRAAAKKFSAAVSAELRDLAMPDASLGVEVPAATHPEDFSADGADVVTMLLTPHAGSEPRPLGKGASGGELSRIMLAIEVVLAGVSGTATFVFDEVDAGIGGKVAVEVGRRLARLARSAQVIVVTHLPQVAAFADHHVVVTKDGSGNVTASSVTAVEGADRVRELVRMLSGLEDSASGAEHAAELLALAESDRAGRTPRSRGADSLVIHGESDR